MSAFVPTFAIRMLRPSRETVTPDENINVEGGPAENALVENTTTETKDLNTSNATTSQSTVAPTVNTTTFETIKKAVKKLTQSSLEAFRARKNNLGARLGAKKLEVGHAVEGITGEADSVERLGEEGEAKVTKTTNTKQTQTDTTHNATQTENPAAKAEDTPRLAAIPKLQAMDESIIATA